MWLYSDTTMCCYNDVGLTVIQVYSLFCSMCFYSDTIMFCYMMLFFYSDTGILCYTACSFTVILQCVKHSVMLGFTVINNHILCYEVWVLQ